MRSQGSAQLKEALRPKRQMSQSELAEKLDVSRQAVSDWLRGDSKPRAELMAKIEDLLGIPMRSWTEDALPTTEPSTGTDDE